MVDVGGGGVVCRAVQRLLRLRAAADVAAVETAGMLQNRGVETQLVEVIGGGHRLPGVCGLVVWMEPRHTGLCGGSIHNSITPLLGNFQGFGWA